ncbi:hypothetical protein BJ508DRAFT_308267 [Ascobolus immersus RN42]|uniref:C2H2-type domain-containing protein n=1 Tax=Ascobolus immersus RN42 TaxID=1160509 RepID=A0A3N4I499_ASCIM|nr:hypothetical protein BJ508DRAFT_308267 [Ascobolus immersus RN42]
MSTKTAIMRTCPACEFFCVDRAEMHHHYVGVHYLRLVWNAYRETGNPQVAHVNVSWFLGQYVCAVKGCEFYTEDKGKFEDHCKEHQRPLVFKKNLHRCSFLQDGKVKETFFYGDFARDPDSPTYKNLGDCSSTACFETALAVHPFSPPVTPTDTDLDPETAIMTPDDSEAGDTSFSTEDPDQLARTRDTGGHASTNNADTTKPLQPGKATNTAGNTRFNEMKAALRLKYQEKLFEETMKAMENLDFEGSEERKERIAVYYKKSMEMLKGFSEDME